MEWKLKNVGDKKQPGRCSDEDGFGYPDIIGLLRGSFGEHTMIIMDGHQWARDFQCQSVIIHPLIIGALQDQLILFRAAGELTIMLLVNTELRSAPIRLQQSILFQR